MSLIRRLIWMGIVAVGIAAFPQHLHAGDATDILGKKKDSSREWILAMGSHPGTVDQNGRVVPIHEFRDRVLRDKRWKLFVGLDRKAEALYDVKNDPGETKNLIKSKDPAVVAAKKKFMAAVAKMPKIDNAPKYDRLPDQPWDLKVKGSEKRIR
jgi:hypothetical protein